MAGLAREREEVVENAEASPVPTLACGGELFAVLGAVMSRPTVSLRRYPAGDGLC